jgi:diguanylate cyclase (GGDEF)-like protein
LVVISGRRMGEVFPIEGELTLGRDRTSSLGVPEDTTVSRRHARLIVRPDGVRLEDLGSANGTWVNGERVREAELREGAKIRIGRNTALKFAYYDAVEEAAQRQLLDAALRDSSTRAFNRRYFQERLQGEVAFADRHQVPLALLLLDVDHFKEINDQYGHPVGDEVLRKLVDVLSQTLRCEDVLARYGGEEFVVLARRSNRALGMEFAERLRRRVAGSQLLPAGQPATVTLSIGVAAFPIADVPLEHAPARLIELADAALYRAKNAGRNRVSA